MHTATDRTKRQTPDDNFEFQTASWVKSERQYGQNC